MIMLKTIFATAILTSFLTTGAMAVTYQNPTTPAKHATVMLHKTAMKKMSKMPHCKKGMHMVKHKCVANKY
jgi:hypothetical protein